MIVAPSGKIDDDPVEITGLLRDLQEVHEERGDRRWQLRCRNVAYLGPWAAAIIASAWLEGKRRGQRPKIVLPTQPTALDAFCHFSGLAFMLGKGDKPDPEHPDCETVPLQHFQTPSIQRPDGVVRLIGRHHGNISEDTTEQLSTCINEVDQNIADHASSPIGGVLCARYMTASREVRVAIVDRGIGIAESLRRRYPDTTDSLIALRRVIPGGYSARSRDTNAGIGISHLFSIMRIVKGRLVVYTREAIAELHPSFKEPVVQASGVDFPGTAVLFAFALPNAPHGRRLDQHEGLPAAGPIGGGYRHTSG